MSFLWWGFIQTHISENFHLHNCFYYQKYHSCEHWWQKSEVSPRKTFKHHSHKSLQTLHCCLLILACMGFTRRVWACEGLAPPSPLSCLVSLSISEHLHLSFCWRWWGQSWSFPAEFLRFRDCWEDVSLVTWAPCSENRDSLPSPLWTSICLCQRGIIMSTVPGTIYLSYQLIGYVHTTLKHESSLLYERTDCWNMVSGGRVGPGAHISNLLTRGWFAHPCCCHQKLMVLTVFIHPLKYKCLLKNNYFSFIP